MLNRIVVVNSKIYAKANLVIGDANGIQLVAENNVGKSSLINTLNFLYILNKRDWKFSDNSSDETIKHYFNTIEKSFIIFEIIKKNPYCIIVKRDDKNDLNYFKIECRYEDDIFYKEENKKFEPCSFKEINAFLSQKGITVSKLDKDELYKLIYNTEKKYNPVVLITDKVKRTGSGYRNSFTQMYEHLIKASEINEDAFKRALIIADNKQDQSLEVFTSREQEKLIEFENKRNKYHVLESIQTDFVAFKVKFNRFEELKHLCGKLRYNFLDRYNLEALKLTDETDEKGVLAIQIRSLKTQVEHTLPKESAELNQQIGTVNKAKIDLEGALLKRKSELEEIDKYKKGTIQYDSLISEVNGLKNKYENLIQQLVTIAKPNISEKTLLSEIGELKEDNSKIEKNISNYSNLAHQYISDDPEIRKKIFSYLREDVLNQTKDVVLRKISSIKKNLELFDGLIDVANIKILSIPNVSELKEKVKKNNAVLEEKEQLLSAIKNIKSLEREKEQAEKDYYRKKQFLEKIDSRDSFIKEINDFQKEITEQAERIVELKNLSEYKDNEIKSKSNEYDRLKSDFDSKVKRLEEYKRWYYELKEKTTIGQVQEKIEGYTIEEIYQQFSKRNKELEELFYYIKDDINMFSRKLDYDINDWKLFVTQLQEEIDTLPDLKKSIDNLFETNIASIINSVNGFIKEYHNFKGYVRKFSQKISNYPVSNIVKTVIGAEDNSILLDELIKIGKINTGGLFFFTPDNKDSIELLKRKFEENKTIEFKELFDIEVEIELNNGIKKKVKLNKKIESEGTDAVFKLFLFLSVIRELAVNQSDNKIVVYFDELGKIGSKNVAQVVKYCEENSFIPVFAAPYFIEGVQKYIPIKPSSKKQGIVIEPFNEVLARRKNADTTV